MQSKILEIFITIFLNVIEILLYDFLNVANYFANYFHKNSCDIRKIWQGVKDIISLKASSSAKPIFLKLNDTVTSDPLLVAKSFNSYFSFVADKIRPKILECDKHLSSFLKQPNLNSVFLSPVTSDEVCKLIQSMYCSKISEPYNIPTKIFKLVATEISFPLAELVNLSFSTGKFPSLLKLSKVIPIFKKGCSSVLSPCYQTSTRYSKN